MLIVTTGNERFAPGAMALIESLTTHNPVTRMAFLDQGLTATTRQRMEGLCRSRGVDLLFLTVDPDAFRDVEVGNTALTPESFGRLLLPELLPDEDVVLYLDSDMLVVGDLGAVLSMQIGDDLVAAVPDPLMLVAETEATGVPLGAYINSGMMVMNLARWRAEGITAACLAFLRDGTRPRLFADQSAVNVICRGRIRPLPREMNALIVTFAQDILDGTLTDPRIIHFVGPRKPWLRGLRLRSVWEAHYRRCGRYRPLRPRDAARLRMAAADRLGRFRRFLGLLAGKRKYVEAAAIDARVAAAFSDPYLRRLAALPVPD